MCSGETACRAAQAQRHGPALEGLGTRQGGCLRGLHVLVGVWKMQLNVAPEFEAFRSSCPSAASAAGRRVLAGRCQCVSLWVSLQELRGG